MAEILEFTGILFPDATGFFVETGTYNGKPYYYNSVMGWYLWFDVVSQLWTVSEVLGNIGSRGWTSTTEEIISAEYILYGTAQGLGDMHVNIVHYHVYRGQDGNIDYENIVAEMALDAESIEIPNQVLPPGTIWHYVRRQVAACTKESMDSPLCKVIIDADGDMVPLCPNAPLDLEITPAADGKFELRWRYNAADQEIQPTGFKIYLIEGEDWTLLDTVTYTIGGHGEFNWTSSEFENGQRCNFCVHSYAEGTGESQNTNLVSATADAVGPPVITGLEAVVEEI